MPRRRLLWQLVASYTAVCCAAMLLLGLAAGRLHGVDLALWGLFVAALAGLVVFHLTRSWSRVLVMLRRAAEQYAAGHLARRLPSPASDELGGLVEAMNQMAAQLDQRLDDLRRQRNQLEGVLASMGEGVLAVDVDDRVLHLNGALAAMLGLDGGPRAGATLYETVRQTELQHLVLACLSDSGPIERDLVLRRQGAELHVQARATPLVDAAGQRLGALLVLEDVTRLHRLEGVRSEFVANVTHELRTPITAICGFVETLQDGALDEPETARRFIDVIARHAARLNQLIEELLQLADLEQSAERQELSRVPTNLRAVAEAARQAVEARATERRIEIEVSGEALTVSANGRLLETALVNLLNNAVAYSELGGRVEVRLAAAAGESIIEVQDWGCGIAPEHQTRVFERFYRVDRARSREHGGTGLGLALVKHIAQLHGGRVALDSRPGEGSTFRVTLPCD